MSSHVHVSGNDNLRILASVAHAAGSDDLLPIFDLVKITRCGELVTAQATDRYILATATIKDSRSAGGDATVYVPAKDLLKFVTAKRYEAEFSNPSEFDWRIGDGTDSVSGSRPGGRYPELDRLFKGRVELANGPVCFDSRLFGRLERIAKTAKYNRPTMSDKGRAFAWRMAVAGYGPTIATHGPITVMVMPRRGDDDEPFVSETYGRIDCQVPLLAAATA